MSPFASWISKDSASLSKRESAVIDSTFSNLSLILPISRMVNLWVLNLWTNTSLGVNVYGGIEKLASIIALSITLGGEGFSAETPSIILKSPLAVKNNVASFAR